MDTTRKAGRVVTGTVSKAAVQREVGEKSSEREKKGTVCIDQVGANCTNKTNKQLEEPSVGYACLQQAICVGKGSQSAELHVSMNLLN